MNLNVKLMWIYCVQLLTSELLNITFIRYDFVSMKKGKLHIFVSIILQKIFYYIFADWIIVFT